MRFAKHVAGTEEKENAKRFDGKNRREIPHENARKIRRIQLK
jgi:hypothetical protein